MAITQIRNTLTKLALGVTVYLLTLLSSANGALAFGIVYAQEFPALTGRVVDLAGLLNEQQESALTETLADHEQQTSNQIVVVTINDLEGYAIADYTNRLGRHWGIGTAELNNGVILLVAPNERKVRIETGYGLEGALTDLQSSLIIQREILPAFRTNNYPLGISKGITGIISSIAGEYEAATPATGSSRSKPFDDAIGQFIPLIFIAMIGLTEFLRRTGMRKAANGAFPAGFAGLFASIATGSLLLGIAIALAVFLFVYFKGQANGSGTGRQIGTGGFGGSMGGGFGGGFSGGGGSFGGGGASGSW